jgi:hypothetical protein
MFRKVQDWLASRRETSERRFYDVDHALCEKPPSLVFSQPAAQFILPAAFNIADRSPPAGDLRREARGAATNPSGIISPDKMDALLLHVADTYFESHGVLKSRMIGYAAENFRRHARENALLRHRNIAYFATLAHEAGRLPSADRPEILNTLIDTIPDLQDDEGFLAFDLAMDAVSGVPPASQAEMLCRLCDKLRSLKLSGNRPQQLLHLIERLDPTYRRDPLEYFATAINFLREDRRPDFIRQVIHLAVVCSSEQQSAIISSLARRCLNGFDDLVAREKILRSMIDAEELNGPRGRWSDAHQNCLWNLARVASQIEPLRESAAPVRIHALFDRIPPHLQRTIFRTLFSGQLPS